MKSEFGTEQGHLEELSKANDIIHMAKFEILMEKAKGKPRQSKAPTVEQKSDVCEEEQQQKDLDIEQEVKEAEQKKHTQNVAGEVTDTRAETARQEAKVDKAEGRTAREASVASAAAANGKTIEKRRSSTGRNCSIGSARNEWERWKNSGPRTRKEDNGEARKRPNPWTQQRDQKMHQRQRKDEKKRTNSKDPGKSKRYKTFPISRQWRSVSSSQKSKTKKAKQLKLEQESQTYLRIFHEDLYEGEEDYKGEDMVSCTEHDKADPSQLNFIPEFTTNEIQDAIDRLKTGKAKDSNGTRAEQLKNCSDDTKEKIRTIFNEIAQQEDFTPKSWRKIPIKVIYQEGDREDPGNYRPICSLPDLYKLFATVLFAQLAPFLHKIQPPSQAGFRPNHRCEDHLTVYRILEQRCREWSVPLYISTIDFRKAFDSIRHSALMEIPTILRNQASLREFTTTAVQTSGGYSLDRQREWRFPDQKRYQAGRSAVLSFVQHGAAVFAGNNLKKWQENKKASSLRIADDVLLFSTSLGKLCDMLFSNQDKVKAKEITVVNIKIEILEKGDSARYLGHKITFEDQETTEVKNRLKAAWAAFHKYRQELTSKDYRLCHRLRLFKMVITSTLTYASGTWTLTQKHEKIIKTAQRKMLRLIIQTKRKYQTKRKATTKKDEEPEVTKDKGNEDISEKDTEDDSQQDSNKDQDSDVSFQEEADEEIDATENEEAWIEFIKRSTTEAEEHMEKYKIPCWIELHSRTKWRMAPSIVFLNDKRWNKRVFDWHLGLDTSIRAGRQIGRPKRRWEDDLNEFLKMEGSQEKTKNDLMNNNSWMAEAKKYKEWKDKEESFAKIW